MSKDRSELVVVMCGGAGQGIKTIEALLTHVLKRQGYNVFATKEMMSRIRGGCNSTELRVSSKPVTSHVERIDLLIALNDVAVEHLRSRITADTLVVGSADNLDGAREKGLLSDAQCVPVSFADMGRDAGSKLYANSAAAGLVLGVLDVEDSVLRDFLHEKFSAKGEDVWKGNLEATRSGTAEGRGLVEKGLVKAAVRSDSARSSDLLLTGAEAVGLGAIAGGCNVVGSYPMSPSTSVLVFLARHADKFGIAVEQAEDEIAAINMGLGAWFAGGRALATTSGGGFALMCEGMSLAGMFESPMVIHLAQRPGPATGLPTRTEQGDLELAVYAGHGEYPRIVLAPGSPEQAFELSRRAFDLADRLHVPVIILTDQFLVDSHCNVAGLDVPRQAPEPHVVETDADYRRYALTDDGLSPRGVPGYGSGVVCLDSDEHDEEGHITEDLEMRTRMVDKRLKRFDLIAESAIPAEFTGRKDAPNLVVAWGSTLRVVQEALDEMERDDIALLHFPQVFPLPPGTAEMMNRAGKLVVLENNATGQFAKLLKLHADAAVDASIRKYNGMPFSVEEVQAALTNHFPEEA